MKHSIARKVTRRVALLLLAAIIILFVGAYQLVSNVIYREKGRYALAVLGIYTDLLAEESRERHIPIDAEHSDKVILYGETLCDWYAVDYVYLYTIDEENSSITYIAASAVDGKVENPPTDHLVGYTVKCKLHPEELAVWNGEQFSGHITANSSFGHEVSTLLRIEDDFGNRLIAGVDISYQDIQQEILLDFALLALIITAVVAGIYIIVYRIIRKTVSQPAQLLSRRMQEFITDGKRSSEKLSVADDGTEYAMIASAFNRMTDDIDSYVENINALTRDQAQQQTELDIASRIQQGFLPAKNLTAPYYEVHGIMTPARDVGGDLYDYVALDDRRVLVVIADVSGKGMSAAMFMAVTLTLIRQFAKMGLTPDEILRRANDTLSENNAAMLFATAFVGIYDSETGLLTYSNAGHNPPYIIGRTLQKLDGCTGTLLGLFPGEDYAPDTVPLGAGETLFLYTDGVSEAINAERKFFGTERLEETLRFFRASHAEDALACVSDAVAAFSGDAEQHDDITMLTLTAKQTMELSLLVDVRELEKIKAAILSLRLPRTLQLNLCLAAEECFVNICSYAFEGRDASGERILFNLSVSDRIRMRFEDGGIPYDPLEQVILPEDYDMKTQIGGLGKLISFSIADDVRYEYRDGKNVLTLTKYFEEEDK